VRASKLASSPIQQGIVPRNGTLQDVAEKHRTCWQMQQRVKQPYAVTNRKEVRATA
jgi:hypothetical protein